MAFSTPVTPTRERPTRICGLPAWTSGRAEVVGLEAMFGKGRGPLVKGLSAFLGSLPTHFPNYLRSSGDLRIGVPYAFHRIKRVAVLGAGTMGAAIAAHCANAGLEVDLLDIASDEGDDKDAVVRAGFDRMKNARPAALMSERAAGRISLGN